jgi:3-oxoacyl-[acyl-carrier protein] reductase
MAHVSLLGLRRIGHVLDRRRRKAHAHRIGRDVVSEACSKEWRLAMDWTGQVALVTGAARGIGQAIARLLAERGAAVAVNYATHAKEAEELVRTLGSRALAVRADVADAAAVTEMVGRVTGSLGNVTVLVNNSGITSRGTIETYDAEVMAQMRRVNVDGVIHAVRAVAPAMIAAGYGRIVNITSVAAIGTALSGTTFYAATKAEVLALTRRFAFELGSKGITVNAVAPGWIMTDMTRAGLAEAAYAERARLMAARTMVGRAGTPEDIANAVAFLAAPESGFLTAQVLTVDGGRLDYIGHG